MLKTPFESLRVNGSPRTGLLQHGKWVYTTGSKKVFIYWISDEQRA
jgi:hypothetical protein